jgi:hypothetical protein
LPAGEVAETDRSLPKAFDDKICSGRLGYQPDVPAYKEVRMFSIDEKAQSVSDEASQRFLEAEQEREHKLDMLSYATIFDFDETSA